MVEIPYNKIQFNIGKTYIIKNINGNKKTVNIYQIKYGIIRISITTKNGNIVYCDQDFTIPPAKGIKFYLPDMK